VSLPYHPAGTVDRPLVLIGVLVTDEGSTTVLVDSPVFYESDGPMAIAEAAVEVVLNHPLPLILFLVEQDWVFEALWGRGMAGEEMAEELRVLGQEPVYCPPMGFETVEA